MQDPAVFNQALEAVSPAYREYAGAKLKGWQSYTSEQQSKQTAVTTKTTNTNNTNNTNEKNNTKKEEYKRPRVILGTSDDYANHYAKYLNPKMVANEKNDNNRRNFLDFGAAPGGLCRSLLEKWEEEQQQQQEEKGRDSSSSSASWVGLAVTLGPKDGGLEMDEEMLKSAKMEGANDKDQNDDQANNTHFSSRLFVRYRDVCDADAFTAACSNPTSSSSSSNHHQQQQEWHWADFVNCGIVLDAKVKSKKTGKIIGYGEQLFIQLVSAMKALRNDGGGDLMVALRFDFPSLPETIPTIELFRKHCKKGLFILPTLYTESAGRKQFYLLVRGLVMTEELCLGVKQIWNQGRERYVKLRGEIVSAREQQKSGKQEDRQGTTRRPRDEGEEEKDKQEENDNNDDADTEQKQQQQKLDEEKEMVFTMVRNVYQAVGPTLDEFCILIKAFLEKSLKV